MLEGVYTNLCGLNQICLKTLYNEPWSFIKHVWLVYMLQKCAWIKVVEEDQFNNIFISFGVQLLVIDMPHLLMPKVIVTFYNIQF